MSDDNRVVRLESDVQHLQSDVTEIKGDLKSLKAEFLSFKAEVAKEFGSIRTSMERTKLWMVVTGARDDFVGVGSGTGIGPISSALKPRFQSGRRARWIWAGGHPTEP